MDISGFAAYPLLVERTRPANTDVDTTPPAPGDLELARGFLSLHDHVAGTRDSLPPSSETIAWWLRERGLLAGEEGAAEGELRQRLLEQGLDPRQVHRAVRYGRAEDLGASR